MKQISMVTRIFALMIGAVIGFALWAAVPALTAQSEAWDVWIYVPVLLVAGAVIGLLLRAPIWLGCVGCVLGQLVWMLAMSPRGPWSWWFSGLLLLLYTLPLLLGAWFVRRVQTELVAMRTGPRSGSTGGRE